MQSLINKLRPTKLNQIIGQENLTGENKILNKIIKNNSMFSFILFGPPGTGKTTIARALANELNYKFKSLNAVNCSKKDLTDAIEESKKFKKIVLLLDEFHRLTKPMQDILLPEIEFDNIFVIGCTTQNPYHTVAPAIRSRMRIFEIKKIGEDDIFAYLKKISNDKEIINKSIIFEEDSLKIIARASSGDLRFAINTLEILVKNFDDEDIISKEKLYELNLGDFKSYDKDGDQFYNTISAFQKSIRGSDVDASLFYLAILINSGDLETICRRLLVIAYEDIGLANPNIGSFVLSAIKSAKMLGFPEARIPLANAVIQLALSMKSNTAVVAIDSALKEINNNNYLDIPYHLRDNHYNGAEILGNGVGYKYPHNFPNNYVKQQYLPDKIKNKKFYNANITNKNEKSLKLFEEYIKSLK